MDKFFLEFNEFTNEIIKKLIIIAFSYDNSFKYLLRDINKLKFYIEDSLKKYEKLF